MTTIPGVHGDTGKLKFHLLCAYHGEIAVAESEDEAYKMCAAHMLARHADANKKVAPSAEMMIEAKLHVTPADLETVPSD